MRDKKEGVGRGGGGCTLKLEEAIVTILYKASFD